MSKDRKCGMLCPKCGKHLKQLKYVGNDRRRIKSFEGAEIWGCIHGDKVYVRLLWRGRSPCA